MKLSFLLIFLNLSQYIKNLAIKFLFWAKLSLNWKLLANVGKKLKLAKFNFLNKYIGEIVYFFKFVMFLSLTITNSILNLGFCGYLVPSKDPSRF